MHSEELSSVILKTTSAALAVRFPPSSPERAKIRLPLYGITLDDIKKVWQDQGKFVPLEEAYTAHVAAQLKAICLEKGYVAYDGGVALAQAQSAKDNLTGFYRGDFWETNIELAQEYVKINKNNIATAYYKARLGGDEFVYLTVTKSGVTVQIADFANLSGLNPALSSEFEILQELNQKASIAKFAGEENNAITTEENLNEEASASNSRRKTQGDDRRIIPLGAQSVEGYQRADEYLKAMVQLYGAITERPALPNEDPEQKAQRDLKDFYTAQKGFNKVTGLDRIQRLKQDTENVTVGTGLAIAFQILDKNNTSLNLPQWWEAQIKEQKVHCQTIVKEGDPLPLIRIDNPEAFEATLKVFKVFMDQYTNELNLKPFVQQDSAVQEPQASTLELNYVTSTGNESQPSAKSFLEAKFGNAYAIVANGLAGVSHDNEQKYKNILNGILNNYLGGAGRVLHLSQDIQSAADKGNSHVGLLEIGNFAGMNAEYTHHGCDAISSTLYEIANSSIQKSLSTLKERGDAPDTSRVLPYEKVGLREREDAGKMGFVFEGITAEQATALLAKAKEDVDSFIVALHLDKLPCPKAPVAGVRTYTTVKAIPQDCNTTEAAFAFVGTLHEQLNATKTAEKSMAGEGSDYATQQVAWQEHQETASRAVKPLTEEHKNASLPAPKDIVRDLQLNPPHRFASSVSFDYRNSDVYPDLHTYESLTIQLAAAALSGR